MLSALVLTAGLGTRLDPVTRLLAKPAVPLGSQSLIEHVIARLSRHGVRDLLLNLHHRPDTIATIVGDGSPLNVTVRYSWEQPVLGSAGGPRHALPLVATDPFLIVNGDTLCDVDLADMHRAHAESGADVTMAVVPNTRPDRYNGIRADAEGIVRGFVPKGRAEGTWHFVGVQIVNRSVFASLADGVPSETVAGIYPEMIARTPGRVRVWPVATTFLDVGTPADYLSAAMALASVPDAVETPDPVLRGSHVRATVDRAARTLVWADSIVHASAHLRDCIVAGGAVVPAGFSATDAVIVPSSVVRPDEQVEVRNGLACFPIGS